MIKPESYANYIPDTITNAESMQLIKSHGMSWDEFCLFCLESETRSTRSSLCVFDFMGYCIENEYGEYIEA